MPCVAEGTHRASVSDRVSSTTKERRVVLPTSRSRADADAPRVPASAIEASFGEVGLALPWVTDHAPW